jgi:cytochrome c
MDQTLIISHLILLALDQARRIKVTVSHGQTFNSPPAKPGDYLVYLSSEDIRAMAVYLKSIAENEKDDTVRTHTPVKLANRWEQFAQGSQLYEKYCQECHDTLGKVCRASTLH